jgi:hypothetical protein
MMPPRAKGGRVDKTCRAKGGGVSAKSGPAWEEGRKAGTQVSHVPAKEPDIKNMNRPKVVTFASGGKVKTFKAYATGGRTESTEEVASATKLPGGAGGGEGRLAKMKKYGGRPMREVDGAR